MWEEKWSRSRSLPYYYNPATGESVWERPDSDQIVQDKVRVRHILIKHSGSRNPVSWRNPNITITLDKLDAIKEIEEINSILSCASFLEEKFSEIAISRSDCSSAKRGGDLGFFQKGQMQKSFEDISFSILPGQLSDILETDSGVHLIFRIE